MSDLEHEFQVSSMTIRRDLRELDRQGLAKRTHGGAVAPALASHEDSFGHRLGLDVDAKERLAVAAAAMIEPGETVFVDSSSSAYYAAREILTRGIRASIITNSVPVMQLFTVNDANVELIATGGWLRRLSLSLVGPAAVRTLHEHFADKALFSVKGLAIDGSLTDPDPLECEIKRTMIARAEESILLLEPEKLETRGSHLIASCKDVSLVLAADLSGRQIARLNGLGARVRLVDG